MSRQRKVLEAQLTPQQRRAAELIIQNEWGELLGADGKKKTMQELADEIGIARSTLFEWKSQEHFTAYGNYLAERNLDSMRSEVYTQLMRAIRGGSNGIPSVKALDLFMRRYGLLTDRTVVEDMRSEVETKRKTDDEIRAEIDDLNAMINGTEEK
ncbi:phBC6A51 family helix-turn-helix protein [Paenibacillus bouchesdurhonensis]|uniref:phBC6A51 family helix-turn-helix protein n=1 Tax=Paenibacillus bouchesdurhonensis TaxID=1870990 RepID=UPI000DA60798|nr:phBC6A51 family helix-turn-helix protein [Paenibacillus bouchesdurhonensis]